MRRLKNVIGPKVRQLRYKAGLTQEQFAAKCQINGFDISRGVLSQIEAQLRCVEDFEVVKFCKILKVPPETLLGNPIKRKT